MPNIIAHTLPPDGRPHILAGSVCVIFDVLRASTTMTLALENGAAAVAPCLEVEQARNWRTKTKEQLQTYNATKLLLGGERKGLRIEGFDLGNSPAHYNPQTVAGALIAFTTTNGTRAIQLAQQARAVLVGALINRSAVASAAQQLAITHNTDIHLIAAGTNGKLAIEDVLAVGAVIDHLERHPHPSLTTVGDEAILARAVWQYLGPDNHARINAIRQGAGGRNVDAIGLESDIHTCAQLDTSSTVPILCEELGVLKPYKPG